MEKSTTSGFVTKETEKFYVPVTELKKGDSIVNLGTITAVYPNPIHHLIQIVFTPSVGMVANGKFERSHLMWYTYSDKLMKA